MPEREENHYCEPVQEIMGRLPSWTVRWGPTILAGILCLILVGSYFIRWPEVVPTSIFIEKGEFGDVVGTMSVEVNQVSVIHTGNSVSVRLKGQTGASCGTLMGAVSEVCPIPESIAGNIIYTVKVSFPNETAIPLPAIGGLSGDARIMVGEKRLLERLAAPMLCLLRKR